jgi:hypothetical protein
MTGQTSAGASVPALLLSTEKVTASHRSRDAYVYVRQSTPSQPEKWVQERGVRCRRTLHCETSRPGKVMAPISRSGRVVSDAILT